MHGAGDILKTDNVATWAPHDRAALGDAQAAVGGRDVREEANGMEEESDEEQVEQQSRWREQHWTLV